GASSGERRSSWTAGGRCAGWKPAAAASTRVAPSKHSEAFTASARASHIFLYGTLMRGEPAHQLLAGHATFVGQGHIAGTLLDLGSYPGLVAGRGRVRGEVWRLAGPEVLRTLDEYEGYNFERQSATATLVRGRRVRVSVYRFRGRNTRRVPRII